MQQDVVAPDQSPDPFRVWVNALHNFGMLTQTFLYKRIWGSGHVQIQPFEGFLLGPCTTLFCIPHPQYFDMFWDLVIKHGIFLCNNSNGMILCLLG